MSVSQDSIGRRGGRSADRGGCSGELRGEDSATVRGERAKLSSRLLVRSSTAVMLPITGRPVGRAGRTAADRADRPSQPGETSRR